MSHRWSRVVAPLAASAVVCLFGASSASAFEHDWGCQHKSSASYCFDVAEYHTWIAVQARIDYQASAKMCARAWTAAGNERTGSGCSPSSSVWQFTACLNGSTPNSRGLGYFINAGQTFNVAGYAATPSSNLIC